MYRPVYARQHLARVLSPRSIAVVGVSNNLSSFGARTMARLEHFQGQLFQVNPRYENIGARTCYPSVSVLPEVPDCAVVATGRDQVVEIVRECADAGVGGCIIYASGFAEVGTERGVQEQDELTRIAQDSGMRIIGPNCIGLANFTIGANITFYSETQLVTPAAQSVGIVSQSGALGNALIQSIERGTQVSHMLASGNSCDVDVADFVSYLVDDSACRAIACLFEGMNDPSRMVEAARRAWAADKPLILYKIAESEQGASAAMSHTGSLAGSHAAYRASLERYGVVFVDQLEALMETAAFFAKTRRATAKAAAVIATSGGATVIAADKAEAHGIALLQPQAAAQAVLDANVPDFGSARNPCDVTAQVVNNPTSLTACLNALFADPTYGAIVLANPYASSGTVERIDTLGREAAQAGKAACWVSFTDWLEGPGLIHAERHPHVGLFRSFDRCFRTLSAWQWRSALRDAPVQEEAPALPASNRDQAAMLLDQAGSNTLTEREAKAIMALYDVPVVQERLVQSADEAVQAASGKYPVVIKVESPSIPHKTEAGVIRLNLGDEAALRDAYSAIMANALRETSPNDIRGVLVQPMVPSGVELMIGVRNDPQFGPLLVVGMGGIMVELLRDTALLPAPVTVAEAENMLRKLKGFALLNGFRGADPVDFEQLVRVVCNVGCFAADHADRILEVDINPLICAGGRITAVDALIVRKDKQGGPPRFA
ncbi:acetate--CoA ligase family protein [Sphingomonadales bacterium 56]|uniref:acetate--CoA ligase family protein n=1 Tax=unclassified Sphingobium TaxID=2611147 RepID=UPI001917C75A|nr:MULTISPECIES: acetate--CoA ligase family protein [unclassified Sphingobium]MBY2929233.1 acetate--CoA ligase family protein [Sphingomonadales bacterium 56]MBY2958855.1 acetate--CoA ligase family protein [Sphingomonadales bacterium 58]CAD7337918.1 Trans-feruloyl-CoA synthase FCS1 [Sphingobium sp. S8]CAD7339044.1 Trans-feruloyl-CoA synthase FCS1 [Sphingobium sp. S6]